MGSKKEMTGTETRQVNGLTLYLTTVPEHPKAGNVLLKLKLTDQAGKPVTNAQVLFVYTMPMPGMTDSKVTARHTKDGLYEGTVHVRYGRYLGCDGQCDGTRATAHCRKVSVLGRRRGHVILMIARLIEGSARNPILVILCVVLLASWGLWAGFQVPLDAVPDLSDVQVTIYTEWQGRSPTLIEDQVTYPIVTSLLAGPKVKRVRGVSEYGVSYVYVIFEDRTDLYWARSRVLEYMQKLTGKLPSGVTPTLGPDATGVGWVYQYALVDESGAHDLAQLRSLQDWYLRFQLESVPGVAEVSAVGGFVKQYQIEVDPNTLAAYRLPIKTIIEAVRNSNAEVSGRVLEMAGTEYVIRGRGYLRSVDDIELIPVGTDGRGTPILIRDIAHVQIGPDQRRGVAELDGKGQTVGGIVIMRAGENALAVIERIKAKLAEITPALPKGVHIVPTYDRSDLIHRAIAVLREKLVEESLIVSLVAIVFLFHFRSALVAILILPVAVLLAFIPMAYLHITSSIMSLGGIAIAIGAMVDAAIVMVENAHKRLEQSPTGRPDRDYYRGGQRSRPSLILLAAGDCRVVPADLRAGSAGGAVVHARWPTPKPSRCCSPQHFQ